MILEHAVKTSNVVEVREILKTASLEAMDETDFNGRTPLMLACFRGNSEVIKLLIKGGAGTHSRDRWGKTALMYAVQRGHVETVQMLLDTHADASARDNDGRIVEGFARPGTLSYEVLLEMLRTSVDEFEESRSRAGSPVGSPNSRSGRAASPQLSLEEKDTKPKTIHQTTRRGILPDIIPTPRVDPSLVQHDAPFCFKDPLELARRGLDNELKAILPQMGGVSKFGLNQPNERGRTPLMVAILNGKLESCLIIIKAGGLINETDLTGKTVLFYAIAKRSIETINALIDAGANPEAVDKFGRTPLMQACMDGNVLAVQAVLKTGAGLTASDNKGRTALMYALAKGNIATIKEMIAAGADPTAKDHSGKRVQQFALTRSNFDKISPLMISACEDWKVAHPSIHDTMFPETFSFQSPPGSPFSKSKREEGGEGKDEEAGHSPVLLRDDSFFGSPSRLNTASSFSSTGGEGGARKRQPPMFASPFNPKANRSTLELVRIADYVALDDFLDGCSLVAVNEKDKKSGRTALMVAVLQQKIIPARMLIDAGADLEIKDCQGKTALAHAAANGNMECITLLLDARANILPLDSNGRTPVDQAELSGNEAVYNLLVAAASSRKKRSFNRSRSSFESFGDEPQKYEESKHDGRDHEERKCNSDKEESKQAAREDDSELLRIDCE